MPRRLHGLFQGWGRRHEAHPSGLEPGKGFLLSNQFQPRRAHSEERRSNGARQSKKGRSIKVFARALLLALCGLALCGLVGTTASVAAPLRTQLVVNRWRLLRAPPRGRTRRKQVASQTSIPRLRQPWRTRRESQSPKQTDGSRERG